MEYLGLITLGFSAMWFILGMWVCSGINDRENEKLWLKDADEFRRMMADRDHKQRMAEWIAARTDCCPEPALRHYDATVCNGTDCADCWLRAADAAVKEARDA